MNGKGCVTILTLFATTIAAIAEITTGGEIIGKFICKNFKVCIVGEKKTEEDEDEPNPPTSTTIPPTPIPIQPSVSPKPTGKNITISQLAQKFYDDRLHRSMRFFNVYNDKVKDITGDIYTQSIRRCYYPPIKTYAGQSKKESQCLGLYYSKESSNYVMCYFPPDRLEEIKQLSMEIDGKQEEEFQSITVKVRAKIIVNPNASYPSSGIQLTDCQLIK